MSDKPQSESGEAQTSCAGQPSSQSPQHPQSTPPVGQKAADISNAVLEQLLIPGTTASIRAIYTSLSERASSFVLAEPEPEFVVLDTETTGFDPHADALIEVAAVVVRGAEVLSTFASFVNPERPIPERITEITHITNADVASAPSAAEVMERLLEFCGERPIIAHNAHFDQAFIQANLERTATKDEADKNATAAHSVACPLSHPDPWIDTVELARIALPLLREHKLESLSAAFAPNARSTHRALDDVLALVRVWRVLLVALSSLPPGLAPFLSKLYPKSQWASRQVLELVAAGSTLQVSTPPEESLAPKQLSMIKTFSLQDVRKALTKHLNEQHKSDAAELAQEPGGLKAVDAAELAAEYTPEGLLGAMYPHYETRAEQRAMAEAVAHAQAHSSIAVIEAGTGVGKSMAYLVPAALFAKRNNITLGVATKSNALLDQLLYSELPRLQAALEERGLGTLEYLSLKGYDHYPCLRKLMRAASDGEAVRGQAALVAQLLVYVSQSVLGDLDAVSLPRSELPRWEYVASAEDCLNFRCRYYRSCLLHSMRRQAEHADIVVTNHALLFCDVMCGGSLLPPVRNWIIDEAHGAEDEARRQLSSELSARALTDTVRALLKGGLVDAIRNRAAATDGGELILGLASKALAAAEPASALTSSYFAAVGDLLEVAEASEYNQVELWLDARVRATAQWGMVNSTGRALIGRLEQLGAALKDLIAALNDAPELLEVQSTLAGHTAVVVEARETLTLILDGTDPSFVYSAQLDRRTHLGAHKLVASYYDVGNVLAQQFYPEQLSVVYTSATIALAEGFGYFNHSVGLDRLDARRVGQLKLDSSYNFDANMTVFVPTNLIEPNNYQKRNEYLRQLDDLIFEVHCALGGSVLTLFTNRREMEETFERLQPGFEAHGLEVICQRAGISRTRLRERFVAEQALSLFALRSFWEGFDAPGETLRCVIIPKLPFGRPNDPLQLERDQREQGAWKRFQLPAAVLSLKQAAGRLIRSSEDSGFLVLADARLITKFYGRSFLDALPSRTIHFLSSKAIAERMRDEP